MLDKGKADALLHNKPSDIERTSMWIIRKELEDRGIHIPEENAAVIMRVIHATADFDYADNMFMSDGAVLRIVETLLSHIPIVTDTNMALSGISRPSLLKVDCEAYCFMAGEEVAERAKANGTTRAAAAMEYAREHFPGAILAVGNAPTALFKIAEQIEGGLRPAAVIAVPVGFVNVTEGKERIRDVCLQYDIPIIAAMGRKGGSTVAAAIINALLYTAVGWLDPSDRGWN